MILYDLQNPPLGGNFRLVHFRAPPSLWLDAKR
jgi:hypothetical protein